MDLNGKELLIILLCTWNDNSKEFVLVVWMITLNSFTGKSRNFGKLLSYGFG